jgi:acyl dehydratase
MVAFSENPEVKFEPYRVSACNLAKNSENRMHDDAVARRFGFQGGLVRGVEVFAYMSHMPVAKWGRAFLNRGLLDVRFTKPIYDGEVAVVTADEVDGSIAIEVDSRGELCASGQATIDAPLPEVALDDFQKVTPVAARCPVDADSYPTGKWLGITPYRQGADAALEYLRDIRETNPIYADGKVAHPGILLRMMNGVLMENAILGPWIHLGSTVRYLATASVEDELTVRAIVTDSYERKGHKFVKLDGLVVANGMTPIAHCQHVAIYQPRETMAA